MRRYVHKCVLFTASCAFFFTVSSVHVPNPRAPYRVGLGQRIMFDVVPTCVKKGFNIMQPVHLRNCPCFVSFGLSSKTPSRVQVDFLVLKKEKFTEWRSTRYSGEPDYVREVSATGKRANEYNMVYDNFFFQTLNIELLRNETFVLAIRTSSDKEDCGLEIMHIFQSMPLPCPARLRSGGSGRLNQTGRNEIASGNDIAQHEADDDFDRLPVEHEYVSSATELLMYFDGAFATDARTAQNLMKNGATAPKAMLRLDMEDVRYSKTDQYTSTNNVVAGTEVSDLNIRLYMVSIRSSSGACSGTVIGSRWILTAAHCQAREGGEALVGGDTNLNGASYRVNRFIAHPEYKLSLDGQVEPHDIAVIETDPMKHGKAVLLNVNGKGPDSGRFVRASGYGQVAEDWTSGTERALLQVDIPIVSFKKCIEAFVSYGAPEFARTLQSKSHMCAGYADDDCAGDTCYGDSGGPIVVRADGKYVQVGVVSGGIGCARKGLPGFYTRVGRYWEWIQNVTNGEAGGYNVPGDDGAEEVNVSDFVDQKMSGQGLAALRTLGIIIGAVGLGVIVTVLVGILVKRVGRLLVGRSSPGHTCELKEKSASLDQLLKFEKGTEGEGNKALDIKERDENVVDVDNVDDDSDREDSEYQQPTYSRTKTHE